MKRFVILFSAILVFVLPQISLQAADKPFFLIDELIRRFQGMGKSGSPGLDSLYSFLDTQMEKARELRKNGVIGNTFFQRYRRLLGVIRVGTMEDKQGILTPMVVDAVNRFMSTKKKIRVSELPGRSSKIGLIASSISEEMIALRFNLSAGKKRDLNVYASRKLARFDQLKKIKGKYILKGQAFPFSGKVIKADAKGNIEEEIEFNNGIMHGQRVIFDEDGSKRAEGMMTNDIKSGLWIYYDYNGNIEKIVSMNSRLRQMLSDVLKFMEKGDAKAATKSLNKAIKMKSLDFLHRVKNEFPLHLSVACSYAKKYDEAIKYARIWAKQKEKDKRAKKRDLAAAFYRLGASYWLKANKRWDRMTGSQRKQALVMGMDAINKAIAYSPDYSYPYAYLKLFYRLKARLEPAKKAEYQKLGEESHQKFLAVMKAAREKDMKEMENPAAKDTAAPTPVKKKPAPEESNIYYPKEDKLFSYRIKFSAPPPPPPPPPKRKR